jgi:hypothetical protein
VDYSQTVSCYQATDEGLACGRCDACRLRREGFLQAGLAGSDPLRREALPRAVAVAAEARSGMFRVSNQRPREPTMKTSFKSFCSLAWFSLRGCVPPK